MSIDLSKLNNTRRLLFDVPLQPLQGTRFQPTGFPDLGAATYQAGDTDCLLVESAQSMANRLELQIWDEGKQELKECCNGLSYVRVVQKDRTFLTASVVEPHRVNSGYIKNSKEELHALLAKEMDVQDKLPIDRKKMAATLMKFDAGCMLHGAFLESIDGRLRVARALSAFIEARNVQVAQSGGVKTDMVDPKGDPKPDFGMVPYPRTEFTSNEITAFFNLDLEQIRGYGLSDAATNLLILLALYKIRSLLDGGLRLRTACDLCVKSDYPFTARAPAGFPLPGKNDLETELKTAVAACAKMFSDNNGVTTVTFTGLSKRSKKGEKTAEAAPATDA
jgi:CRISPR-associated protein Csb1